MRASCVYFINHINLLSNKFLLIAFGRKDHEKIDSNIFFVKFNRTKNTIYFPTCYARTVCASTFSAKRTLSGDLPKPQIDSWTLLICGFRIINNIKDTHANGRVKMAGHISWTRCVALAQKGLMNFPPSTWTIYVCLYIFIYIRVEIYAFPSLRVSGVFYSNRYDKLINRTYDRGIACERYKFSSVLLKVFFLYDSYFRIKGFSCVFNCISFYFRWK